MTSITQFYDEVFDNQYPDLKKLFNQHGVLYTYTQGECVIEEDMPAEGFYWIVEGGAKVFINVSQESTQIVTVLSAGDLIGVSAVLNDHPYKKSAKVVSEQARIMFVGKSDFYNFMQKHPLVALPLLKKIESKIDKIEARAAIIMRKSIDQRLAYVFLMLKEKFGCDEKGFLNFQMSPKDLANFIGTTRTTVYRVLRKFQDNNILVSADKKIQLLRTNELEKMFSSQAVKLN